MLRETQAYAALQDPASALLWVECSGYQELGAPVLHSCLLWGVSHC